MSRLQTAILVLLVVDCIVVGWRPEIVRALPQTSSFYKLVGLSVNLRGLAFDGVATTTEQHEGVPVLVVEGKIINVARTVADVPRLKFIVRDASPAGNLFLDRCTIAHVAASRRGGLLPHRARLAAARHPRRTPSLCRPPRYCRGRTLTAHGAHSMAKWGGMYEPLRI